MDLTKPMYLIVVDLETMGLKPGCVVTEIGAVAIDVTMRKAVAFSFTETLDYASSTRAGFKADKKIIDWWAEQLGIDGYGNRKAYESQFANRWRNTRSIKKSIAEFSGFYRQVVEAAGDEKRVFLVGNDIDFDKTILEHYYVATNTPIPWHYRAWLSLPTFVWMTDYLTGVNVKDKVRETWKTSHTGLDDAKQETAMITTGLDLITKLMHTNSLDSVEQEK